MGDLQQLIAATLAALRKTRGLKQQDLAALAGMSKGQLSNYERAVQCPQIPQLERVLSALDVSFSEFFWHLEILALSAGRERGERGGSVQTSSLVQLSTRLLESSFRTHKLATRLSFEIVSPESPEDEN